MKRSAVLLCVLLMLAAGCAGSGLTTWQAGADDAAGTRFIPVALWTGESWDGTHNIMMFPADEVFGKKKDKRIKGPMSWKHPVTGEQLTVYERTNEQKKGVKYQIYTVNADRTALIKLYDHRPGKSTRVFSGQPLFPLGLWRQGESRSYAFYEYIDGLPVARTAKITITDIRFSYKWVPHSLAYEWEMADENGRRVFHEAFVYSPEKGQVRYENLM